MSEARREYDIKRKKATLERLQKGFRQLKQQKAYKNKPVTKYALSKHTGVAKQTIDNYPEIMELLRKEKERAWTVNTAEGPKIIHSIEDALRIIARIDREYLQLKSECEAAKKANTTLNLTIVRQASEIKRLTNILDKYRS